MPECITTELRSPIQFESLREDQLDRLCRGSRWLESSPGDTRFIALFPLKTLRADAST